MDFGITIKPDIPIDSILSLTRQAESAGFSFGWIFDSHVIWMEPFPLLTLMAANTKNMHSALASPIPPFARSPFPPASSPRSISLPTGACNLALAAETVPAASSVKSPPHSKTSKSSFGSFRNLNAGKIRGPGRRRHKISLVQWRRYPASGLLATDPKPCVQPDASATA